MKKVSFATKISSMFTILMLISSLSYSQGVWDGGGDGVNWSSANNWDDNFVPNGIPVTIGDTYTTNVDAGFTNSISSLTIGGGTDGSVTLLTSLTVTGSIVVNVGATLDDGGNTINVGGDFTNDGTFTASGSGIMNFNGSGSQNINSVTSFRNLNVSKSSGTLSILANINVNVKLYLTGGTIDLGSPKVIFFLGSGTVLERNTSGDFSTTSTGQLKFDDNATVLSDASINLPGLNFIRAAAKTLTLQSSSNTFTLKGDSERGGNHSLSLSSTTLAYSSGLTLTYSPSTAFNVGVEWPASSGPDNVTFTGTTQLTLPSSTPRTIPTTGVLTLNATANFSLSSVLTINGTVKRQKTGNSFSGTATNVQYSQTSTDISTLIYDISSGTGTNFNTSNEWPTVAGNSPLNVSISHQGTTNKTITLVSGDRVIGKTLTLTAGILAIVANNLKILGSISASDVAGSSSITASSGVITMGNGSNTPQENQTISGNVTLANLTIDKNTTNNDITIGTNSVTISNGLTLTAGDLTISGPVTITTGNFTQTSGTTNVSGFSAALVVTSGNLVVSAGTFTNSKSVTITNASNKISVASGAAFVTGTGASSIQTDEIELLGTGSYKTGGKTITSITTFNFSATSTFEVDATQTLPSTSGISYGNLTASSTAVVTAGANFTLQSGATLLVTGSSTFDANDFVITKSGSNTLQIDSGSILKTGTSDVTGFTTNTLSGTVNYDGITSQNLISATYNNLTLGVGSGVLTSQASSKVTGTLTFTSGTINAATNALTLGSAAVATASSSSFVSGTVTRETDGSTASFVFPTGNSTNLRSATIVFSTAPATSNTISVTANGTMSSPTSTLTLIRDVETEGYWTIAKSAFSASSYTLTVNASGFTPTLSGTSNVKLILGTAETFNTEAGTSASAGTNTVTSTFTGTNFGDFAIGNNVDTKYWINASGGNWSTAANWSGTTVPATGDIIVIKNDGTNGTPNNQTFTVTYDATTTQVSFDNISVTGGTSATVTLRLVKITSLNLSNSTTGLTLSNNSTTRLELAGTTLGMNGGSYNSARTSIGANSTVSIESGSINNDDYGNLIVNSASGLSNSGGFTVSGNFTAQGGGVHSSTGGAVSVTGTTSINGGSDFSKIGTGNLTFGATTLGTGASSAGDLLLGGSGNHTVGSLTNNNDGTLTISTTGTTTLSAVANAGAITFNASAGAVTISGAYSGAGTITSSNSTSVTFGSTFQPGGNTTFGTQTVNFTSPITLNGGVFTPATTTDLQDGVTSFTFNGGSISSTSGRPLVFDKSNGSQTIAVTSGSAAFQELTINNSNNVSGTSNIAVNGVLTLTSGNFAMGSNTLTLGTSGSNIGTLSGSGTISGTFARWFAASTVSNVRFPLIVGSNDRLVNMSFTGAPAAGIVTASFVSAAPGDGGIPFDDSAPTYTINTISDDGYWSITSAIGGTYSLDLSASAFGGIASVSNLHVVRRNTAATNWSLDGTHSAGTGTIALPIVHRTGMTLYGEYTLGSNLTENTLPVEMVSVVAKTSYDIVKINWETETETNNSGFIIMRKSGNSGDFVPVNTNLVKSKNSTSSNRTKYEFTDKSDLVAGTTYKYKIRSVDLGGQIHDYQLSSEVEFTGAPTELVLNQNYPNPFNPTTTFEVYLPKDVKVSVEIFNILGQNIRTLYSGEKEKGLHSFLWDGKDKTQKSVSSGVYFYQVITPDGQQLKKMTLMK